MAAVNLPKHYRVVLWIQVVYALIYAILMFGMPTVTIRMVISDETAIQSNKMMRDALMEFFRYLGGAFFMIAVLAFQGTRATQHETMQLVAVASLFYFVPSLITNLIGMLFLHEFALISVLPPFLVEVTIVLSHAGWLHANNHRTMDEIVNEETPLTS